MEEEKRAKVLDLNPHLLCSLCSGYMIEASTIIECLHSFCKSCIFKYLESSKYCPICDVQIHKTKPHINIKPDKTLQTLVYKLVPRLLQNEMQRRQEFFDKHPGVDSGSLSIILPTEYHHVTDRYKFLRSLKDQSNWISVCIKPVKLINQVFGEDQYDSSLREINTVRYLYCPPDLRVYHIKKLLKEKFEISEQAQVEIYHDERAFPDTATILSLTENSTWDQKHPFDLEYSIKVPCDLQSEKDQILCFSEAVKSKLSESFAPPDLGTEKLSKLQPLAICSKATRGRLRSILVTESSRSKDQPLAKKRKKMVSTESVARLRSKYAIRSIKPVSKSLSRSSTLTLVSSEQCSSSDEYPLTQSPPVLHPQPALRGSNHLNRLTSLVEPLADEPSKSSSKSTSANSSFLSSSSPKDDCIITGMLVPKKLSVLPESKRNRNIFELVQPLLGRSTTFFEPPYNQAQTFRSSSGLRNESSRNVFSCMATPSTPPSARAPDFVSTSVDVAGCVSYSECVTILSCASLVVTSHQLTKDRTSSRLHQNFNKEVISVSNTSSSEASDSEAVTKGYEPANLSGLDCGTVVVNSITGSISSCKRSDVCKNPESSHEQNYTEPVMDSEVVYLDSLDRNEDNIHIVDGEVCIANEEVFDTCVSDVCVSDACSTNDCSLSNFDSNRGRKPVADGAKVIMDTSVDESIETARDPDTTSGQVDITASDVSSPYEIDSSGSKAFATSRNCAKTNSERESDSLLVRKENRPKNIFELSDDLNRVPNRTETVASMLEDSKDSTTSTRSGTKSGASDFFLQGGPDDAERDADEAIEKVLPHTNCGIAKVKSNRLCKRLVKEKIGFEISCREAEVNDTEIEGNEEEEEHEGCVPHRRVKKSGLTAVSRAYKISQREMSGLFMDMSKKYLKEFPANGFAFDSTMTSKGNQHVHSRRSKQNLC